MPTSAPATKAMVVTITPQLAREWLETNIEINRPISKLAVDQYSTHMKNDEWVLTGQPIIFNQGKLIDGQNRLMACIAADKPFQSLVVSDVDPRAFQYLDMGFKRRMADVLRFRDHKFAKEKAATVKVVLAYEKGIVHFGNVSRITTQQHFIDEIENNHDIYEQGSALGRQAYEEGFNVCAAASMFVLLAKVIGPDDALSFMSPAIHGVDLKQTDPRLSLRRFVMKNKPSLAEQLSIWVKTWNAFNNGKSLSKIYPWKPGQPFPTINKMKESTNVIR